MLALMKTPLTALYKFVPDIPVSAPIRPIQFDQSMTSRHTCPCCSSTLLRHISHHSVYWRCSHCRAPMSVWRQFE